MAKTLDCPDAAVLFTLHTSLQEALYRTGGSTGEVHIDSHIKAADAGHIAGKQSKALIDAGNLQQICC